MARRLRVALCLVAAVAVAVAGDAAVVEHTFRVAETTIERQCQTRVIAAVNGELPGQEIAVAEGDTVVVHLINDSPYNITIHWHGVLQRLTAWSDGPSMVTQCPVQPGGTYTYRFTVAGQEGTLWWHAHVSFLRATVYGALVIRPRSGRTYPFPSPDGGELTVLLGEWWHSNPVDVENEAFLLGAAPNASDALTINGLAACSGEFLKFEVEEGKRYLLRIINAALNVEMFVKVAGHSFTVVAVDACYTDPYDTDIIVVAPGQTVDAIMVADAIPSRYYLAAKAYQSLSGQPYDNTTVTGIVEYVAGIPLLEPVMPEMPAANDTAAAHKFYSGLAGLVAPGMPAVPLTVDEHLFVAYGLGIAPCLPAQTRCNATRGALAASMNNVSFVLPEATALLDAHWRGGRAARGIFTRDFPNHPPEFFDFTNGTGVMPALLFTAKGTKVKHLKYNTTVELVLQNTAVLGTENHPLHLHGFNFFILAQGFGNFRRALAEKSFNLVNPQARNTIAVPAGGWAVIRFTADNPGVWIMHCHLDSHLPIGLAMAFEVDDGPSADAVLPPPPPDYPQC